MKVFFVIVFVCFLMKRQIKSTLKKKKILICSGLKRTPVQFAFSHTAEMLESRSGNGVEMNKKWC